MISFEHIIILQKKKNPHRCECYTHCSLVLNKNVIVLSKLKTHHNSLNDPVLGPKMIEKCIKAFYKTLPYVCEEAI